MTGTMAERLQQMLAVSPCIRFLGLQVIGVDIARQEVTMLAPMRPEFERAEHTRQWHGGPIASIIDTVGDFALVMLLDRIVPTINLRIDYLSPAIDTALTAVATVRRSGRSVGVVDIDVFDDRHRLVAIGRAAYSTLTGETTRGG